MYAFSLLSIFLALFFSNAVSSEIYYVSENGHDTNTGQSWESSWRTLAHAGMKAIAGDEVIVRKAIEPYRNLSIRNSGAASKPIIFRGENPDAPPIISGAVRIVNAQPTGHSDLWRERTTSKPSIVTENDIPLTKASTPECRDGDWHWENNRLTIRAPRGLKQLHSMKRVARGGGIQTNGHSWLKLSAFQCELGGGACISIKNGGNITVSNFISRWQWRGVDILSSSNNTISHCSLLENREGVYVRGNSSFNIIKNCTVMSNGNSPLWTRSDRAGIAIGESGINTYNQVLNNDISYNGGKESDPALIAYSAPHTVIKNNWVHDNYGSGVFVTINSDFSYVSNNRIENNGMLAVNSGGKNISGLSIRRSKSVTASENYISGNYVAADSRWHGKDKGPRAGLDVRGNQGDNMRDIKLINNRVTDTKNGPNIYISPIPDTTNIKQILNK